MIEKIISEAFIDTAKIAPLLFAIYAGIEFLEYKYGNLIADRVKKAGIWGPLAGALAGIIPQCGFSVIATALYTRRLVTIGTLLAVYLSTSDEALPIILSRPETIGLVMPLILTKLAIALVAGYAIDTILRKTNKPAFNRAAAASQRETAIEEQACCGHNASSSSKKFDPAEIFLHPLLHTAKILFFIFLVSLAISFGMEQITGEPIKQIFSGNIFLGPLVAALVGLIPNCAASVAITEFYLNGLIAYGAAIAGLSASAGLGILVLLKEEKNKTAAVGIIALLFFISVISGILVQVIN